MGSTSGQVPFRLLVSRGCQQVLGTSKDVVNSYTGDELVPPDPVSGLICRYAPDRSLSASVDLATSEAVRLAVVIDDEHRGASGDFPLPCEC